MLDRILENSVILRVDPCPIDISFLTEELSRLIPLTLNSVVDWGAIEAVYYRRVSFFVDQ